MGECRCGSKHFFIDIIFLCLFCISQCYPKEDDELLKPCADVTIGFDSNRLDEDDRGTNWFAWGQLYSFCKHNVSSNRSDNFRCKDDKDCIDCMRVCTDETGEERDVNAIRENCKKEKNEPCIKGCDFYDVVCANDRCETDDWSSSSRSDWSIDESNQPQVKNFSTTVSVTHDSITVSWNNVSSNGTRKLPSIYLLGIKTKTPKTNSLRENVVGLVETSTFTLRSSLLCEMLYDGHKTEGVSFALTIYPINLYGPYKQDTALQNNIMMSSIYAVPNPIRPLQTLTVLPGYPVRVGHRPEYDKVLWKLSWPKISDTYAKGIYYNYGIVHRDDQDPACRDHDNYDAIVRRNPQHYRNHEAPAKGPADITLLDPSNDILRRCTFTVEARIIYSQCLLTQPYKKKFQYQGCEKTANFTPCVHPTKPPPKINTYLDPKSIYINAKVCKECAGISFHVNVDWLPFLNCSVSYYKIRYRLNDETKYRDDEAISIPKNETSYLMDFTFNKAHKHGADLCMVIHAITPCSFEETPVLQTDYERCASLDLPEPHHGDPKSSGKDVTIGAVSVVGSAALVAFLIKIFRDRRLQQRQQQDKNNTRTSSRIFISNDPKSPNAEIADKWEIFPDQIDLMERAGVGAFGVVYKGRVGSTVVAGTPYGKQCVGVKLMNETLVVAVKSLKEGNCTGDEQGEFRNEIQFMKHLGYHDNIVNMIGCSLSKRPLLLVVEFMPNGDLLRYLRNLRPKAGNDYFETKTENKNENKTENYIDANAVTENADEPENENESENENENDEDENGNVTVADMMSFAWQSARGMEYLASRNIVHRDLAARNVLVGADKRIKISDFGLSRQASLEGSDEFVYLSQTRRKLPFKWMSLEAIYDKEFSSQSDVWSYGILLFEIVTLGGAPYPLINNIDNLFRMLKSGYRMEKPENCSKQLHHIMQHCWNEHPQRRPTFTELRQHLEKLMETDANYFSLSIDFNTPYYNVASFDSLHNQQEEPTTLLTDEYYLKPAQVKIVDAKPVLDVHGDVDLPDEMCDVSENHGKAEVVRYISQESHKSLTELSKSTSYDNSGFIGGE